MHSRDRLHDRQQAAQEQADGFHRVMAGHHEVHLPCRRHQKAVWLSRIKASQESLGPCCPYTCQLKPGMAYTMSRSRLRLESLSPSSRCRLLDLCVVQRLHKQKHNDKTDKSLRHAAEDDLASCVSLYARSRGVPDQWLYGLLPGPNRLRDPWHKWCTRTCLL